MSAYTWERLVEPLAQPDGAWGVKINGRYAAWAFEHDVNDCGHAWCVGDQEFNYQYAGGITTSFERSKIQAEKYLTQWLEHTRTPARQGGEDAPNALPRNET